MIGALTLNSSGRRKIPPLRSGRQEDAAASSAAMTPLLPVRPGDVLQAARELVSLASNQPVRILASAGHLAGDCVDILRGRSKLPLPTENKRFRDGRWTEHRYYRSILRSWVALDRRTREWLASVDLDEADERRTEFFLNILLAGLSPANFVLTNPEAVDATRRTLGWNLLQGAYRYWRDIRENHGLPTQVDKRQFEVGKDVGVSPGQVVYRSDLFELIQYAPATKQVFAVPLLVVGSYINRYYILDLKPGRSLVEYLVQQGHSVFVIVWRNPGPDQRHWGYADYARGVVDAANVIRRIRRSSKLNVAALCAGGVIATLAASALEAQKKDWINSLTLLINVLDTRPDDTDWGLVCTERSVRLAKRQAKRHGLFRARDLLWSFNLMQSERLIWDTGVDYYLLGKDPGLSEVMFWMNDQVNVPEKLYGEQLDIMLHNPLPKAGECRLLDTPVDLKRLGVDAYLVGAYYDHIMPWHAVYRSRKLLGGDVEFVLTNGGHVTPCITPIDHPRSKYYTNSRAPRHSDEWLETAQEHSGSWQPHWAKWLARRSGARVGAPKKAGNARYPALEAAPGTYVYE